MTTRSLCTVEAADYLFIYFELHYKNHTILYLERYKNQTNSGNIQIILHVVTISKIVNFICYFRHCVYYLYLLWFQCFNPCRAEAEASLQVQ